jgi:hypothetical protein
MFTLSFDALQASISRVKPSQRSTLSGLTFKWPVNEKNPVKFCPLERATNFDETLPSKLLEKA